MAVRRHSAMDKSREHDIESSILCKFEAAALTTQYPRELRRDFWILPHVPSRAPLGFLCIAECALASTAGQEGLGHWPARRDTATRPAFLGSFTFAEPHATARISCIVFRKGCRGLGRILSFFS